MKSSNKYLSISVYIPLIIVCVCVCFRSGCSRGDAERGGDGAGRGPVPAAVPGVLFDRRHGGWLGARRSRPSRA